MNIYFNVVVVAVRTLSLLFLVYAIGSWLMMMFGAIINGGQPSLGFISILNIPSVLLPVVVYLAAPLAAALATKGIKP